MSFTIGKTSDNKQVKLALKFANRHGLITGATGTGKTVTLQRLAEQFSERGVPVFCADIKGDLSGIATQCPTEFWDVHGKFGNPIKTSVQEMGPILLSRMLKLNDTQAGALAIALKRAADEDDYMLTLDDLRWQLNDMIEEREDVCRKYGNVTAASMTTIQRNLMTLEAQGGDSLFGEPPFNIEDLIATKGGKGVINLLHADNLMEAPRLYGALIYWLLIQLFRTLPEIGDTDKPKMIFFFDEAHLLFKEAPKHLIESMERVVRLVRSKGVGVYFVTQTTADVPETILTQLGNRIQHALRAYTPKEQRIIKATAKSFRPNPAIDVEKCVLEMGLGEALVSTLEADGVPAPVERIKVTMPAGQIGPIAIDERLEIMANSKIAARHIYLSEEEERYNFTQRCLATDGKQPLPQYGETPDEQISVEEALEPLYALDRAPAMKIKRHGRSAILWLTVGALLLFMSGQLPWFDHFNRDQVFLFAIDEILPPSI